MHALLFLRFRIVALITGVFLVGANSFILAPILSDVAASLNTSTIAVTRSISAFGGAAALSAFFLARLIGRYSSRLVLTSSALLMAIAFAGCAICASWQSLAFFQALAGLSTGILLPAIYSEAVMIAPEGESARMLGSVLSGWSIALIVGVPASALLSDSVDWRFAYGVLSLLGTLAAFVFASFRSEVPAVIVPVFPRFQVLSVTGVKSMLLTGLFFMTAFYGTYALLGHHVREVQGINASLASIVALAYGLGFGVAGALARHVDRFGLGRALPFFLAASMLFYVLLVFATQAYWSSLVIVFLLGVSNHYGLNLTVLRLAERKPEARGTLIGMNITATYIAVFCGPLLMSTLYMYEGFLAVSLCAGFLLFICFILMWRMRKT